MQISPCLSFAELRIVWTSVTWPAIVLLVRVYTITKFSQMVSGPPVIRIRLPDNTGVHGPAEAALFRVTTISPSPLGSFALAAFSRPCFRAP